jgi:hypothetical protein
MNAFDDGVRGVERRFDARAPRFRNVDEAMGAKEVRRTRGRINHYYHINSCLKFDLVS